MSRRRNTDAKCGTCHAFDDHPGARSKRWDGACLGKPQTMGPEGISGYVGVKKDYTACIVHQDFWLEGGEKSAIPEIVIKGLEMAETCPKCSRKDTTIFHITNAGSEQPLFGVRGWICASCLKTEIKRRTDVTPSPT